MAAAYWHLLAPFNKCGFQSPSKFYISLLGLNTILHLFCTKSMGHLTFKENALKKDDFAVIFYG
ncbi:hypothetical protein H5410_061673 [Solanum commersonii]|uniref:Uncharacterized protein n=1 Tax=Solanum commersonii TaxID=4109 RepID=A0A9J5W8C9_SOLCO|nr:hypothetical protein H5410_061673 [Solanum commersonii]